MDFAIPLLTDYDYDGHLEKFRTLGHLSLNCNRTHGIHLIEEHLVSHGITYPKAEGCFVHLCNASGK